MSNFSNSLSKFIKELYRSEDTIPLHAPVFMANEENYVLSAINSTYVSSVGKFVDKFENDIAAYIGGTSCIATVNGTSALHTALVLAGVKTGDLVMTQALTFVATCNAISYCGAQPVFIDVDRHTMGLSPTSLDNWLTEYAYIDDDGNCRTHIDNKIIRACLPMHTFGHPVDFDSLLEVCLRWRLPIIEDAAESLGSLYKGAYTGTLGTIGTLSFNGNKIITTGGGGMIVTDKDIGARAKHLTTTSKVKSSYEFFHDQVGYNYRMPNLNAAMGCAQLEKLDYFIKIKRRLAECYDEHLKGSSVDFVREPVNCRSNYWLNAVICEDRDQRDVLLKETNDNKIMTRPIWTLMSQLPMYKNNLKGDLLESKWLADRVVNLPSGVVENLKL